MKVAWKKKPKKQANGAFEDNTSWDLNRRISPSLQNPFPVFVHLSPHFLTRCFCPCGQWGYSWWTGRWGKEDKTRSKNHSRLCAEHFLARAPWISQIFLRDTCNAAFLSKLSVNCFCEKGMINNTSETVDKQCFLSQHEKCKKKTTLLVFITARVFFVFCFWGLIFPACVYSTMYPVSVDLVVLIISLYFALANSKVPLPIWERCWAMFGEYLLPGGCFPRASAIVRVKHGMLPQHNPMTWIPSAWHCLLNSAIWFRLHSHASRLSGNERRPGKDAKSQLGMNGNLFHSGDSVGSGRGSNIKGGSHCSSAVLTRHFCCICHCTFIVLYFLLLHCLCGQSLLSIPNQDSLVTPSCAPL